eukprot:COSAG01_NODE_43409_length_430_cov_0.700906_1_plen_38_part_01
MPVVFVCFRSSRCDSQLKLFGIRIEAVTGHGWARVPSL